MLGSTLRQARESRELPLREVEWATKIKAEYLQALEDEEFDKLPPATYARGFLRTYAFYLDLDPEPLIAEYNRIYAGAQEIVSTRPAVRVPRRPLAVTPAMIAAVALVLVAIGFVIYLKNAFDRYQASRAAVEPQATAQPHFAALPTPSPSPSASPSPSPKVYTGVEVVIRVDAPTWLRVEVDGKVSDQTGAGGKTFDVGTVLVFDGTAMVHVRSGKAAHTFVTVNGKDQGPMAAADSGDIGDKTYQKG